MGRRLRYVPPHSLVEVSCRCIQGRFLLRPGKLSNLLIVGALAKAVEGNPLLLGRLIDVCEALEQ